MADRSPPPIDTLQREAEDALMGLANVCEVDADMVGDSTLIQVFVTRKLPESRLATIINHIQSVRDMLRIEIARASRVRLRQASPIAGAAAQKCLTRASSWNSSTQEDSACCDFLRAPLTGPVGARSSPLIFYVRSSPRRGLIVGPFSEARDEARRALLRRRSSPALASSPAGA